jgi:hypothetical protein
VALVKPSRRYVGRNLSVAPMGVVDAYLSPVPGLPPDVGDAEIFDSDPIYVAGFNTFMVEIGMDSLALNTVDVSVEITEPVGLTPMWSDFIGSSGGTQTRIPFGAGTGVVDPYPWIVLVLAVTSAGGVVGFNIKWRLYFASR